MADVPFSGALSSEIDAAVLLDDALAEREADAGAAGLGGEEHLEHARQDVGRDRRSAVVQAAAPLTVREHARRAA